MRIPRRLALLLAGSLAACGGEPTDDEGSSWDEDWNDGPPISVCRSAPADHETIAGAIASATSGDIIDICPGFYGESLVVDGKALWLRGLDVAATTLDGGGAVALTVTNGGKVRVDAFTITNGAGYDGGGVACTDAAVRLTDVMLRGNRAVHVGGGMYAGGCEVLIERTTFEGNSADEGGGLALLDGAVDVVASTFRDNEGRVRGGGAYVATDAVIEDSTFTGNRAGWTGGGLYIRDRAPILRRNTITDNEAVEEGGGAYLHQSGATLEDNDVADNRSMDDGGGLRLFESRARLVGNRITRNVSGADGGGLKISHLPSELIDNEITDNFAAWSGGGLELDNDSSVVRGGVISGNETDGRGGGIHVQLWPWNDGVIEGVTISGNRANDGGGIYLDRNFVRVTLRGLTIEGNGANQGGAVYLQGVPLSFTNSLLRGNDASREGGAIFAGKPDPWNQPCPCPPENPGAALEFLSLHGNDATTGSAVYSEAHDLSIESSILDGHAGSAIVVAPLAPPPRWRYNDTHPAAFAGMGDPTGRDGNLSQPPAFRNAAAGDFRLHDASPCIDAGDPADLDKDGSRADMGLFAGPNAP